MAKKLGVTCDEYKVVRFRERLIKEGFNLTVDKQIEETNVHFFQIEVDESEFEKTSKRLGNVLTELEIEIKQSN